MGVWLQQCKQATQAQAVSRTQVSCASSSLWACAEDTECSEMSPLQMPLQESVSKAKTALLE